MADSLKHSSSRKIFLKDGKLVKFYPTVYGYVLHELARILFQILSGVHKIDFVSSRRRLHNEIRGRRVLASMGIRSTRIISFSMKNCFLEEKFEKNSQSLGDIEYKDVKLASKSSETIGKITRKLNDRGYYFIDNRSNNWLVKNRNVMRTDLELFREASSDKNRDFYAKCDYLSFVSSLSNNLVKESFISGYKKQIKYSAVTGFLVAIYIRLTDFIF